MTGEMQSILEKSENPKVASAQGKSFIASWWPALVIAGFWLVAVAFIGLNGSFPLNDDWIYSEAVQHFLQTGQLRLLACAPACLFHLVSAAAVCKVLGFNYAVLRGVGFFWAVVATYSLYGCCRQLRLQRPAALLMTLCFAANPLFMCLAFTFMTDTPAVALTLAYTYFLLSGLRKNCAKALVVSSICLIAGTCVRQNLAFMALVNFALLLCLWIRKKHSWTLLLGLVVTPLVAGYLVDKWMLATCDFTLIYTWYKGMVAKQVSHLVHLPGKNLPMILQIVGELVVYLGLFLIPVLVCFLPAFGKLFRNKGRIGAAMPVLSASLVIYSLSRFIIGENRWMPFSQNLLRLPELGAHSILGVNYATLALKWKANLTWISGFAGFLFGALLFDTIIKVGQKLWRFFRKPSRSSTTDGANASHILMKKFSNTLCAVAVVLIFLLQFAFNTLQSTFSDIDRYYLFPLLGAVMVMSLAWRWQRAKLSAFISIPLLLFMAAYSLAGTQDMMAWNRARWTAIDKLEKQGVNFKQIDGGAEYNYVRDPKLFKNLALHDTWYELTHRGQAPRDNWRWWSVAGEDYIVSFSPVPDYEVVDTEKYWSAIGGKRELYALHHVPPPPVPSVVITK